MPESPSMQQLVLEPAVHPEGCHCLRCHTVEHGKILRISKEGGALVKGLILFKDSDPKIVLPCSRELYRHP